MSATYPPRCRCFLSSIRNPVSFVCFLSQVLASNTEPLGFCFLGLPLLTFFGRFLERVSFRLVGEDHRKVFLEDSSVPWQLPGTFTFSPDLLVIGMPIRMTSSNRWEQTGSLVPRQLPGTSTFASDLRVTGMPPKVTTTVRTEETGRSQQASDPPSRGTESEGIVQKRKRLEATLPSLVC